MKLSNRRVKKIRQKLRSGRFINNSELSVLNLSQRRSFMASKMMRVALISASSALQIASISAQPIPMFAVQLEDRDSVRAQAIKEKALKCADVAFLMNISLTSIFEEKFKPWSRKAYAEVYNPKLQKVGNYAALVEAMEKTKEPEKTCQNACDWPHCTLPNCVRSNETLMLNFGKGTSFAITQIFPIQTTPQA